MKVSKWQKKKQPRKSIQVMLELFKTEHMEPEIHTIQALISVYKANFKHIITTHLEIGDCATTGENQIIVKKPSLLQ